MYKYNKVLDAATLAAIGFYLVLAPYSKVEESFTTQAIHDIANYGVFPQSTVTDNYDHIQFPGVVPRTFVGSVVLGFGVRVISTILNATGAAELLSFSSSDQLHLQFVARALLGFANFWGFRSLRTAINAVTFRDKSSKVKGLIGFWFSILLLSQFHLLFYSTRTLPNFVALPVVLHGFSKIIRGDVSGLTWLAFVGVVFRLEIGVLAGLIGLVSSLVFGQSNIFVNIIMLVAGTLAGLATSFFVDSYFWGYWVIPELVAFKFNVIDGNASSWGVEPYGAYFTDYLLVWFRPPVVLMLAIPGFLNDPADDGKSLIKEAEKATKENKPIVTHPAKNSLRILSISSLLYVLVMSFQPHKEWRFIIYVAPIIILQAANGLANISIKWSLSIFVKLLTLLLIALVYLASILSVFMAYASSYNYPGGYALATLNQHILEQHSTDNVTVHLGVAACMTGALRFGQLHNSNVIYDKTESNEALLNIWNDFDYLVAEAGLRDINGPEKLIPFDQSKWELLDVTTAFGGVSPDAIITLIKEQSQKRSTIPSLVSQIVHELINQQTSPTFLAFAKTLIIEQNYLYIWKRIGADDLSNPNFTQVNEPAEDIKKEIVDETEVKIDDIEEEINEEIDRFESAEREYAEYVEEEQKKEPVEA